MRVAICVASYRRPQGLLRLLAGLERQRFRGERPELRAIVVDNDAGESARSACEAAADGLGFSLHYLVEKRRGIAGARNAALAAALGAADFVAFIDDDEVPEEGWLDALLQTQREHAADAVAGPCRPRFEGASPAWLVAGGFFARPEHADGARLSRCYTHNALVRCAALASLGALFDERLSLTGGEDVELFQRFAESGFAIVWSAAAVVYDCVPESRATAAAVLRRAFRTGASAARIERLRGPAARAALRQLAHGGWCLARGALALGLAPLRGRAAALRALQLLCWSAGRLWGAGGLRFDAYR